MKALEENGIGRPSTYAPTISTLLDRGYVRLEDKRFFPEDIGDGRHRHRWSTTSPTSSTWVHGARWRRSSTTSPRARRGGSTVLRAVLRARSTRTSSSAGGKIEPPVVVLDELCPRCPEEGREPGQLVKQARPLRQVHRLPELPGVQVHPPARGRGRARSRSCSTRRARRAGGRSSSGPGGSGRSSGARGYPECKYIKKEPPKRTGVTCPRVRAGRAGRAARAGSAASTRASGIPSATSR